MIPGKEGKYETGCIGEFQDNNIIYLKAFHGTNFIHMHIKFRKTYFRIGVSDDFDFFEMRAGGSKVVPRPGYITNIEVTPLQLVSSSDLQRTVMVEQRKCRFKVIL